MKQHPFRVLYRFFAFSFTIGSAVVDFFVNLAWRGRASDYQRRAAWHQYWAQRTMASLRVRASYRGQPPARGLLVSNHLSYVDILVLAAQQPAVFVAKSEVRQWPIIGWVTSLAGTIYVSREKKSDVSRVGKALEDVVHNSLVAILFPEGTSTDGHEVKPFRSSLLAPAADHGWTVTPAWIGYTVADGSVEDEVAYWRDMTFVPHFLNLLSKKEILAEVVYAPTMPAIADRKELARQLQAQVNQIAIQEGRVKG